MPFPATTFLQKTCRPSALGSTVVKPFGVNPKASKAKPAVYTHGTDPGLPPGTSTSHTSRIDLGKQNEVAVERCEQRDHFVRKAEDSGESRRSPRGTFQLLLVLPVIYPNGMKL